MQGHVLSPTGLNRMKMIYQMIDRGMIQSISIPTKKVGSGRSGVKRRSPDLRSPDFREHKYMPRIMTVMSELLHTDPAYYCGFDPTADSLHLGHMTVLSSLLNMAKEGYPVVALIGGVTSRLGDPTGKEADRPDIQSQIIDHNTAALETQLKQIFSRYSEKYNIQESKFRVLNNMEWYKDMTVGDYKDIVASKFKLVDMLDRSVVQDRLAAPSGEMKFSEFIYQTFQAYDWLHLHRKYGCSVQIGGYDQIGNIEDGYTYIWRAEDKPLLAGLTVPLVVTKNGEKLGKSSGNAIWLDKAKTTCDEISTYLEHLSKPDLLSLALKITPREIEQVEGFDEQQLVDSVLTELSDLTW